jgi:hypothetical protein
VLRDAKGKQILGVLLARHMQLVIEISMNRERANLMHADFPIADHRCLHEIILA